MPLGKELHYPVAPETARTHELIRAGDWLMHLVPSDPSLQLPSSINNIYAYQPKIFTRVVFSTSSGWVITEGHHPGTGVNGGSQGVIVTGNAKGLTNQGWNFAANAKTSKNTLAISVASQKRGTVDINSSTAGSVRGFLGPKEFSAEDMAIVEAAEEAGLTDKIRQHIAELGYPVNMMPQAMDTQVRGGAVSFTVRFPRRLLELVNIGENKGSPRWRVKKGILQAEATDSAYEGITRSEFVNILEATRQTLWSGTVDAYTMIAASRILLNESNVDFSGFWSRLPPKKSRSQHHNLYSIQSLDPNHYDRLIGQKPLWDIDINGQKITLNSLWAINPKTGQEVAYGEKPEATHYDGFAFEFPQSVVMPVVEIGGQLFVGGKIKSSPNIAETNIFETITCDPSSDPFAVLSHEIGISSPDQSGIVLDMTQSGGPINPDSAHFTSVLDSPHFAHISPDKVVQTAPGRYHISGGDPEFIFIPLEEALMSSPHGPTVLAASVLCGSGNIVSLK